MKQGAVKPLRIGVLSDTHLPASGDAQAFLLDLVEFALAPVDMLIHAGDLVAPELLGVFGDCPVHAVRGNMDPATRGVPIKKIIKVGGFKIGLIHGWGAVRGIEQRVRKEFPPGSIDCLIYGHSHRPACHRRDGILFFNPGSATDCREMPYHSVGLLEVGERLIGTIIQLD